MAVDVYDQGVRPNLRDRTPTVRQLEFREYGVRTHHAAKRVDLESSAPVVELELLDARIDPRGPNSQLAKPVDLPHAPP